MTCGWTECRARPMDFRVKTNKSVTTCFEALITTRPSSAVFFDLASIRSSNAISNRQISNSDCRKTFTNSLEMVSRFFSRKPLHEYSTVSEKWRTMNAKSQITIKFIHRLSIVFSRVNVLTCRSETRLPEMFVFGAFLIQFAHPRFIGASRHLQI